MSELATKLGVSNSAVFYANCIVEGISTFKRCPIRLKNDVAFVLVILGNDKLITDETYLRETKDRAEKFKEDENNN